MARQKRSNEPHKVKVYCADCEERIPHAPRAWRILSRGTRLDPPEAEPLCDACGQRRADEQDAARDAYWEARLDEHRAGPRLGYHDDLG